MYTHIFVLHHPRFLSAAILEKLYPVLVPVALKKSLLERSFSVDHRDAIMCWEKSLTIAKKKPLTNRRVINGVIMTNIFCGRKTLGRCAFQFPPAGRFGEEAFLSLNEGKQSGQVCLPPEWRESFLVTKWGKLKWTGVLTTKVTRKVWR